MKLEEAIKEMKSLSPSAEAIDTILKELDRLNIMVLTKERGVAELETLVEQLEKELKEKNKYGEGRIHQNTKGEDWKSCRHLEIFSQE